MGGRNGERKGTLQPSGCNTAYQGDKKSLPSKSSPLRPVILPTLFREREKEREREGGSDVCNAAHNQMLDNFSLISIINGFYLKLQRNDVKFFLFYDNK